MKNTNVVYMKKVESKVDEDIFDGKIKQDAEKNYDYAYLPTQCPQNHASKLLELSNGDILCAWFAGTQEGVSDISIFLSRLNKETDCWSKAEKMSMDPERSEQNPVLFEDNSKKLWLFYTAQKYGNQDTAIVRYRTSEDYGYTWSDEAVFFDEPGTFIRQSIIILNDGTWLFPIFRCAVKTGEKWTGDHDTSAVKVSTDKGKTWKEYMVPDSVGLVHMCINKLKDGTLTALFRSRWADNIYRSTSNDGCHWTVPTKLELPNNNSSIQSFVLDDGDIVMVFNNINSDQSQQRRASLYDEIDEGTVDDAERNITKDVPEDKLGRKAVWGVPRAPMTIAISHDGGLTWPAVKIIQDGDGICLSNNSKEKKNREFSYPSVLQSRDGRIHMTFTYFRQVIKHVILTKNWILEK